MPQLQHNMLMTPFKSIDLSCPTIFSLKVNNRSDHCCYHADPPQRFANGRIGHATNSPITIRIKPNKTAKPGSRQSSCRNMPILFRYQEQPARLTSATVRRTIRK
jgi:hypothetical protein